MIRKVAVASHRRIVGRERIAIGWRVLNLLTDYSSQFYGQIIRQRPKKPRRQTQPG